MTIGMWIPRGRHFNGITVFTLYWILCGILSAQTLDHAPDDAFLLPESAVPSSAGADGLSTLSPLVPEPADFGTDVINALAADPLGPMTDPNIDAVPAFGEPEMETVDMPNEAGNKLWRIRPYLKSGVTYDDNILITNTNRTADIIYNVVGGFTFEIGDSSHTIPPKTLWTRATACLRNTGSRSWPYNWKALFNLWMARIGRSAHSRHGCSFSMR